MEKYTYGFYRSQVPGGEEERTNEMDKNIAWCRRTGSELRFMLLCYNNASACVIQYIASI